MGNMILQKREYGLDILIDGQLFSKVSNLTLEENNISMMIKKEAIAFLADEMSSISVIVVLKQYEELLNKLIFSRDSLYLVDRQNKIIYSEDIAINKSFMSFVQSLIDHENADKNYLTLIDAEESKSQGSEFVYAQIKIPNGYISEQELAMEVFNMSLVNEETEELYTLEEIEDITAHMVLLDHFTLRKDRHRLECGEY